MGNQCKVELRCKGRPLRLQGGLRLSEDLLEGTRLWFQIEGAPAPALEPGTPVELVVEETSHLLWCREVRTVQDGAGETTLVEAADPLAFCGPQPQLASRLGKRTLLQLAAEVVPGLEDLPAFEGPSPEITLEWLLQCQETGHELLARHARLAGHVLYWNRRTLACAAIAQGPASGARSIELRWNAGLVRLGSVQAPDLEPQRVLWVDPLSRRVAAATVTGEGASRSASRGPGSQRLVSMMSPAPGAQASAAGWRACGRRVELETTCPEIALGAALSLPGQPAVLVLRIEHVIHGQGSYLNEVVGVARERWGVGMPVAHAGRVQLLQAEVSHNDDPQGLQRVRVILAEDVERRPSPWIPLLAPAAGSGRGFYWQPEVGDLVMVLAPGECPESLYALGCVRGLDQPIGADWRSRDNEWKVLAGSGRLRIRINDREGSMRFETERASLEILGDGTVRLSGKELALELENVASMKAGREATIDAPRINVGL